MIQSLLLAAQQTENATSLFNWQGTPFIIGSCLLVLLIASRTIAEPHVGPKAPLGPFAPLFNNISLAGFIGAMSFGHILGVLATLGLSGLIQN
ncbi:MAG: photosystem I reaction center subunit PsaK [Oculatellaceae cyanobacterium bins.114]|nr:photosystem I reaction center subunit PsaK [Oculatellaceae cyanobacterium bins.114]